MPAVKRIRPTEIFPADQVARLRTVSRWKGLALVAHAWVMIGLCVVVASWLDNPLWTLLLVPVVGARQLGVSILMHEGAHGLLHPDRRLNDRVGHWLCGAPIGSDLVAYRNYHLQHHKFTQQPEDPDLVLSAPFPIGRASMRRKILRDLTGRTFLKQKLQLMGAAIGREGVETNTQRVARRTLRDWFIVNATVTALFGFIAGVEGIALWWVSQATWFPLSLRIRNIAEHACIDTGDDPFAHARTTHAAWWEKALLAPYWVHYHAEHHLFMYLPCYNLPAAHKLLVQGGHAEKMTFAPGYIAVLRMAAGTPAAA